MVESGSWPPGPTAHARLTGGYGREAAVRLIERIPPQAEVIAASHRPERPAADRLVFPPLVPMS